MTPRRQEDMPRCSDDSETLFSKLDSHAFLAKFAQHLEKAALLVAGLLAGYVHAFLVLLFYNYCSSASLSI
jgi:hypothetical protein